MDSLIPPHTLATALPWIVGAGVAALLGWYGWRLKSRRAAPPPAAPSPASSIPPAPAPKVTASAASASAQASVPGAMPAPAPKHEDDLLDEAVASSIQVTEVNPLEEADVFIRYGYYERAAEVLRLYLKQNGADDVGVLETLLDLYLRTARIDDYAEILERLHALRPDPARLHQAVLAGLQVDPQNLALRVLAQNLLGLGVQEVNALLGLDTAQALPELDEPAPAPDDLALAESAPASRVRPMSFTRPSGAKKGLTLVQGSAPLHALDDDEKVALRAFLDPAREAKIHLSLGNPSDAVPALQRAIQAHPKALVNFVELLKIHRANGQLDAYVRTLWQLFATLGPAGQALKERWLAVGFRLGQHAALEALAQARDSAQIEAIGLQFGFRSQERGPTRKRPLVELVRDARPSALPAGEADATLQEVDAYLEYGQLDLALECLEAAILADPEAVHLYPPLLDIYDRMDALERLTAFANQLKQRVQRPPEEVVAMMSSLFQRLKERTDRLAA